MAEKKAVDKGSFLTDQCCGCRSCELACSYHHVGLFKPGVSSIEITDTFKPTIRVDFYRTSDNGHIACDRCEGLAVPLCVQFCPSPCQDGLKKLLQTILGEGHEKA